MSKAIVNTFKKLDTDTSQNKQDNSSFYDAQNLRLITDEALSNGALVNYKGTKAKIDLGDSATKLKGYAEVGDTLALLLYKDIEAQTPVVINASGNYYLDNFNIESGPKVNENKLAPDGITSISSTLLIGITFFPALPVSAFLATTIVISVESINKILPIIKIYDIADGDYYTVGFNVIKSSSVEVSTVNVFVYNESSLDIRSSLRFPIYANSGVPTVLDLFSFSGFAGNFAVGINISPDLESENEVDIKSFTVHTLVDSDTFIYTLINGYYYTSLLSTLEAPPYPNNKGLGVKVVDTTVSSTILSVRVSVGESNPISIYIPDDGHVYKIYFNPYYDAVSIAKFEIEFLNLYQYDYASMGSMIAKVDLSEEDDIQPITILYTDYLSTDKLGFNEVDSIEVIGRYENEFAKKIYFTVPGKPLRLFNVATNIALTVEASTFDILPNNDGCTVSIDSIISGGNLEAGKIQYACRLFNKYGTETTFSTASELISLTESIGNGGAEFMGTDIENSSGKAVKINIDTTNSNFDYIHIYSIHYKIKDTPVISLVGELPISGNIMSFVDSGLVLDTITVDEYNSFGGRLFTAETLSVKNNILFAANTDELSDIISEEDIDCRAYAFDSSNSSKIYDNNGDYYIIADDGSWEKYDSTDVLLDSGTAWSIPIDADCINKYNDEFEVTNETVTHPDSYLYQLDGLTPGGSGKVISYEIKFDDAFDDSNKLVDNGETIVNSSNINHVLKSTSFKQGETYRVGITFFDLKGRPYFNRWIADIRIPYVDIIQSKYTNTNVANTENIEMWMRNIYIEFTLTTAGISADILAKISGYQITKVERTTLDKSVVAQGYTTGGVMYDTGTGTYMHRAIPVPYNYVNALGAPITGLYPYMTNFISPEFNINGGIDVDGNYRFKVVKMLANPITKYRELSSWSAEYSDAATQDVNAATRIHYPINIKVVSNVPYSKEISALGSIVEGYSFDINSIIKSGVTEFNSSTVGLNPNSTSVRFINRTGSDGMNYEIGSVGTATMYAPTSVVASSNTALPYNYDFGPSDASGYIYILDLYRDNFSSRYGGNTYYARALNTYHSISQFYDIGTLTANAYGDTYNTIFDTLTSIADPNREDYTTLDLFYSTTDNIYRRQIAWLFPIESSVNCMLTGNKPSKYIYNYPSGRDLDSIYVGLTETQLQGINIYGDRYPNVGDLNKYNTAYSAINKYPIYLPEPALFDESTSQPHIILASEVKSNGEFVDNWGKFLYANLLEVESSYGPIHKLSTLDNKLYFFQEKAIGIVAVNEQATTSVDNATSLVLGNVGLLSRYDYITINNGINDSNHVVTSDNYLYVIDEIKKELLRINGAYLLHEYAGVHEDSFKCPDRPEEFGYTINKNHDIFSQPTDLYLYNNTYSREEDLYKFYPKQENDSIIATFKKESTFSPSIFKSDALILFLNVAIIESFSCFG